MIAVTNRLNISLLIVVVMIFGVVSLTAADLPPAGAVKAAQDGLKAFFPQQGEAVEESGFAVNSFNSLQSATVDFGFRVNTIDPMRLKNPGNDLLCRMISPTPSWRFLVLSGGEPIGLITVEFIDGQWQAVSAGAAELALEVFKVKSAWPQEGGYDLRFVRVFQATSDLIEVSRGQGDVIGYVPLKAARVSLQMNQPDVNPTSLMYDSELIFPLGELVKQNDKKLSGNAALEHEAAVEHN